jgi:hypothetical protein
MTDSVQANEANGEQQPFAYTLKQAAALLNISYKTAQPLFLILYYLPSQTRSGPLGKSG